MDYPVRQFDKFMHFKAFILLAANVPSNEKFYSLQCMAGN